MDVERMYAWCLWRSEESIQCPGIRVLSAVVSCCVGAGNPTQALCEINRCTHLLSQLCSLRTRIFNRSSDQEEPVAQFLICSSEVIPSIKVSCTFCSYNIVFN